MRSAGGAVFIGGGVADAASAACNRCRGHPTSVLYAKYFLSLAGLAAGDWRYRQMINNTVERAMMRIIWRTGGIIALSARFTK